MSVQDLKAFGKKAMEDEALKAKAKAIGLENIDGVIALAKETGFEITKDDFKELAKEVEGSTELSDDDLKAVAGGYAVIASYATRIGGPSGYTMSGGGW